MLFHFDLPYHVRSMSLVKVNISGKNRQFKAKTNDNMFGKKIKSTTQVHPVSHHSRTDLWLGWRWRPDIVLNSRFLAWISPIARARNAFSHHAGAGRRNYKRDACEHKNLTPIKSNAAVQSHLSSREALMAYCDSFWSSGLQVQGLVSGYLLSEQEGWFSLKLKGCGFRA